ncbi:leukocyte elastase inhibitor-like isoform X3 [Aphis gossypii]|uniref:leukocyte elastase inhibitor-like isoform X3 n=1 Tax=Aphis gossypii TaxID=80765 RepID=UPI00100FC74D|nr:leukocyte elastase inhibitor-like isoform X3 [Aphis gossypii]
MLPVGPTAEMWSKMLLLSLNIYILLSIVDGNKIVFLDPMVKTNETLALNENGTKNEIKPMSSMFSDIIFNETRPMSSMFLDKIINETKSMKINPMMNETKTMNETKIMNETKTMNETVHQHVQNNSTSNNVEVLSLGLLDATLNIDRSIDSLQSLYTSNRDTNIVISPICMAAAMSLVLLGAKGETKIEVGKLFGYDVETINHLADNQNFKNLGLLLNYFQANSGEKLGSEVNLAKAIFVQNGYNITKNFIKAADEYLNSKLITVNFKSDGEHTKHIINQWVSNETRGKINDIMPDIPPSDTKTIIASALYFTGEWENPFFINYTRIKPFCYGPNTGDKKSSRQNKDCVFVPMMVGSSEVLFHKNEELEFKAIGLPYKGNQFITYFVLPDTNVSLRGLIAKMNGKVLKNITKNTKLAEFTYFVPKMTLKSLINLRPVLQNIGINKMFDPLKADLSDMAIDPGSYISDILHQVEIDINEIGTVASAATVVTITRGGQAIFNVNKPFVFFIHHVPSDTIVFWSTIYKPTPYSITPPNLNPYKKT